MRLTQAKARELRYAALPHAFDKVGVRESVLGKEKKSAAASIDTAQYRIQLAWEQPPLRSGTAPTLDVLLPLNPERTAGKLSIRKR